MARRRCSASTKETSRGTMNFGRPPAEQTPRFPKSAGRSANPVGWRTGRARYRLPSGGPAVFAVARLGAFVEVRHSDLTQIVGRDFVALRLHVHLEHARGIQPEDLLLYCTGERRVS